MPDYEKMYHTLFNAVTDAIEVLQQAQLEAEELYLSGDEPEQIDPSIVSPPGT